MTLRLFLLFWLLALKVNGQAYSNSNFGASTSLFFNFGTHQQSIGINLRGYYTDHFYQINLGQSITWNLKSFGSRQKFWETRSSAGLILMAGKPESVVDFELDGLNHQRKTNYGIGFNYLFYYDNVQTSQFSGGWGLYLKNTSIKFENDVFGGQARDRFRTGHLTINYKTDNFKYVAGLYLWTGETRNSIWQRIPMENCPSGFRLLEDTPFGKTSHGIAYGGIHMRLPYGNSAHLRLGVDSEGIRHAFQNRLVHDLLFLPKSIERNTPHYPMLDEHGCAVFDKKDARKPSLFMQFGLNDNWGN